MRSNFLVFVLIMLSLCMGTFIYISLRSHDIFLNQWISLIFQQNVFPSSIHSFFPAWFLFSLPDGLWMFAFILSLLLIWNFKIDKESIPWISLAIFTGIFFEIGQLVNLIGGTYDLMDLTFILSASALPIIFILVKKNLCHQKLNPLYR